MTDVHYVEAEALVELLADPHQRKNDFDPPLPLWETPRLAPCVTTACGIFHAANGIKRSPLMTSRRSEISCQSCKDRLSEWEVNDLLRGAQPPGSPLADVVRMASELQQLGYHPPYRVHASQELWGRIADYLEDFARRSSAATICIPDTLTISSPYGDITITRKPPESPTVH